MKLKLTILSIFSILLFNCSSSDNNNVVIEKKPTLEFKIKQKQLLKEDSANLLYDLIINNNLDLNDIQWNSSNNDIVAVDKANIIAKQHGEAIITAKVKNTLESASITVVVSDVTINFKQESVTIDITKKEKIDLDQFLMLQNISKENIIWTNNNDEITNVDNKGVVTPLKKGYSVIYAYVKNKKHIFATIGVKVIGEGPDLITINSRYPEDVVWLNSKYKFSLFVYPADSNLSNLSWTSSNPNIATVDNNGVVEGKALGETIIKVKASNGVTASLPIKIITGDITSISVSMNDYKIVNGENSQLYISTIPFDSDKALLGFSSSNPEIAIVDNQGLIKTVKGKRGRVEINVFSKKNPSINSKIWIEVVSAFDSVKTNSRLEGTHDGNTVTGKVYFSIVQYTQNTIKISNFKVFNKDNQLLYEDVSLKELYTSQYAEYSFSLDKAERPYVSYQLQYNDYSELRKENLSVNTFNSIMHKK